MTTRIVEQYHVNDTPKFIFTFKDPNTTPPAVHNISGFTTLQIHMKKPDGTTSIFTAAFTTDGTDGKIEYQMLNGEIDQDGWWDRWGVITSASKTFRSNRISFEVFPQ